MTQTPYNSTSEIDNIELLSFARDNRDADGGIAWRKWEPQNQKDSARSKYQRLMRHHGFEDGHFTVDNTDEVLRYYLSSKRGTVASDNPTPEPTPPQQSETTSEGDEVTVRGDANLSFDEAQRMLDEEGLDPDRWQVGQYWHTPNGKSVMFKPRYLEEEYPPLRPVKPNVRYRQRPHPQPNKPLNRALIIPDSQNGYERDIHTGELEPFHDRLCWDIALQMAETHQPDTIVLLGDMLDLPDWSDKFPRSPEMYWTTQPALNELHWWLSQLRQAVPHAQMVYLEGNHEERLTRAIHNYMTNLAYLKPAHEPDGPPLISIEHMLGLHTIDVEYIGDYPDSIFWLNDNLNCKHSNIAKKQPGQTVGAVVQEARASSIIGHNHRGEMASKTVYARRGPLTYRAVSMGTIAKVPGKTPANSRENNWQQVIGIVDYEEGNGLFEIYPIFINGGKCIWNGDLIEGRDKSEDIRQDTGWPQL